MVGSGEADCPPGELPSTPSLLHRPVPIQPITNPFRLDAIPDTSLSDPFAVYRLYLAHMRPTTLAQVLPGFSLLNQPPTSSLFGSSTPITQSSTPVSTPIPRLDPEKFTWIAQYQNSSTDSSPAISTLSSPSDAPLVENVKNETVEVVDLPENLDIEASLCGICGDRASGLHYGIFTCEG
ncbi:unnamed protein product, partial [Mesorhabditis belari]|uniref:Nuclear receptor domain-containing protein n=1 Tax=Mesorhabditis belari TaxID=2138241 RepID=A0AAF3EQK3_9BILA